ncbi:MAG: hypothetical protein JXR46_14525 [Calditrichaceae bacterium]|nr:hypothetical protein [Calditrichaceae bacterium]
MAKTKKKSIPAGVDKGKQKKSPEVKFSISTKTQDIIFPAAFIIFLLILLKPLVIDGLSPQGVDVVGSIGAHEQIQEYTRETGEKALWNPAVFSGMPRYHRYDATTFSLDTILTRLGGLTNNIFIYYLFGALGFYFLLRMMKMSPLMSFIGALLFILMPHYKSLYLEGHNSKFRALMYLPWIILCFKYFIDRRTILAAALFALSFGLQIRTQHYQIVFYTGLFIFAIGVYPILRDLLDKKYMVFIKSLALVLIAVILAIMMAAQPLFLSKEYLPYSKRGKTTIDIKDQQTAQESGKSEGVSMEYATQWSTHPSELATWLVPRFYGGMSSETYKGDLVPQAKNRGIQIPGYWGQMPFTQSYEYIGIITIILAIFGMIYYRKEKFILSLIIFMAFLILLSFGRHFQIFYGLFYDYVPFFDKFRAPMMSVAVTYFIMVFLAMMGINYLKNLNREKFNFERYKRLFYVLGGFAALGLIFLIYGQMADFTKPGGEGYQADTMQIIQSIRAEFFYKDVFRYILLVLITGGLILFYLKNKINFTAFMIFISILAIGDLLIVQNWVHKDLTDVKKLERQYFKKTNTDAFLLADKEVFRILPVGKSASGSDMFSDNRWAYYHQTIGGYTPIKMYTIEELVEKNIFNGWDPSFPINWNVLKILNVKYIVISQQVQSDFLELVNVDQQNGLFTYLYKERLPRACFVGNYKVVSDEYERIRVINSREFDPAITAVLEEEMTVKISVPDSSYANLTLFTPNRITYDVYTDKQALLKLSEVDYPPGWKIFIDDRQVDKIYRTDHAIQSVVVPAGRHIIEMRFEPDSYYKNINIAYVSLGLLYLSIVLSLGYQYLRGRKSGQ